MTTARFDRITVDPDVLGGKPCIRGPRVSVGMIVQMVAAGKTTEQIIDEYPYLDAEDVHQALALRTAPSTCVDTVGAGASDRVVLERAREEDAVIVTADTDFATLVARAGVRNPSIILMRELLNLPVDGQGQLLAANVDQVRAALTDGAVVVLAQDGIRIRPLPIV